MSGVLQLYSYVNDLIHSITHGSDTNMTLHDNKMIILQQYDMTR